MGIITLRMYCDIHHTDLSNMNKKIKAGRFKSARKIGRDWYIDSDEPYVDHRRRDLKEKAETNSRD